MDKVVKLYNYVDGVNDTPFPSSEDQAIITSFQYDSKRMGNAPTISATLMHEKCLDKLWTYNVYVQFNGEKFFVKQIPSSQRSNTDILYKHDVELVSERVVLDNVYFYDVVSEEAENDKPVSNSTKFTFFGDIHEFAKRLNYSLKYRKVGYNVVVDDGISSEGKLVSFEDTVFSNAIQESYNTYEIPYYFVGKVIHFGFTDNAIPTIFRYGADESLLSIQKSNANYKVVTRITGTGSSDNIPYYYPNESERGALTILYNGSETSNVIVRDWMKLSNLRLEDKLLYTRIESEIKELISGLTVTMYSNISDYGTDERVYEFDTMSKFTMSSSSTVNISFVIGYNKETQVSISNSSGESIVSRTITQLSDSMSVQLGSGVFTLTMTSRIYMPDGVDITSMSEAQEWVNNRISASAKYTTESKSYWSINDKVVFLSDYGIELADGLTPSNGDYISLRQDNYIQPSDKLLPPIYRETNGAERFYEAKNNTYINPQTGTYYYFNNEFVEGNPKEHIVSFEDIKPTIKGMANALGQRIDMFQEFAYDLNDNDDTYPEGSDKAGEYIHPYFFAKLRKFDGDYGFNLFDHAIDEGEMTISMTSGNCGACEWVIGVDEDTKKNIVQVDENGNILRDEYGNIKLGSPQDRQNDTQNNEVWIALKKDINTFGVIMPNATYNYKPSVNDTFVILHIDLPKAYVLAAENRLKEELIKYMAANNSEKFNFSISFSRIYFAENPDILAKLNENARLQIEYDGTTYELYVSSYSYKMSNDSPLPEIQVELSDTLTISQNALQTSIDKVEQDIMRNVGSIDWLKLGLKYFLRKDQNDRTKYSLSVGGSLDVGKDLTVSGEAIIKDKLRTQDSVLSLLTGKGSIIKDGLVQTDRIEVRQSMTVLDLIINELQGIAADYLFSDVGKVVSVTQDSENTYVLYLDKKTDHEITTLAEGDIVQQIVNSLPTGGTDYYSSWFRVVSVNQAANSITVVMYADSEVAGGKNFPPVAGYNIARRGNAIVPDEGMNERSQVWMLSSREGRIQFLQNVFKPTLEDYNYALTLGKLPDIKALKSLPVTTDMVGLVAQTIIAQNFYQFDYNGELVTNKVDRGEWSAEIAQSESPYRFITHEDTSASGVVYSVLQQHTVWHMGCRWACLVDKTTQEPKWNATDWQMLEGYSDLRMEFVSSNGSTFAASHVDTEVTPIVYYGNIDISEDIAASDWAWVYDLGAYAGRVLHITSEMMPDNWSRKNKAVFTCTAYVRVGENQVQAVSNQVVV